MLRNLFHIKPGRLTQSPAPRHLAETPTERTRTLEAEAHIYGHEGFGRHALPPVTEAEWDAAMGGVLR